MSKQIPLTRRTKTVQETADIIGIDYQSVLKLIKGEKLSAIWLGNRYLVPDVAIAKFLGEESSQLSSSVEDLLQLLDELPATDDDLYRELVIAQARHLLAQHRIQRGTP